jgi:hypothetical protein
MVQARRVHVPRLLPPPPGSRSLPSTGESRRIGQDYLAQASEVHGWNRAKEFRHTGARVTRSGEVAVCLDDLDHMGESTMEESSGHGVEQSVEADEAR